MTDPVHPAFARLAELESIEQWRAGVLEPHAEALAEMRSVQLFGARRLGARFARNCRTAGLEVTALSDNDASLWGTEVSGFVVVPPSELDPAVPTVITSQFLHDVHVSLAGAGFSSLLPYLIMSVWRPDDFPAESTTAGWGEDLVKHRDRWRSLAVTLGYGTSSHVLGEILAFRLTLDASHAFAASSPSDSQWFDPDVVSFGPHETLIDGGGYHGETAEKFAAATEGSYRAIHVFEPDEAHLRRAARTLAPYPRVDLVGCGLYDTEADLGFAATGEKDGTIDEESDVTVPVVSLDACLTEPVTFLKLDVEGAEEAALRGARRHLTEERPKIAVAVYHNAEDIWRMPEVVEELVSGYRFALRHYSQTSLETVLYCLPES